MSQLDATLIRRLLAAESNAHLDELELFASIASTNTYLLAQPPPSPKRLRVAIADHQTSGRGRHARRWVSPPGAGLCLSLAYTFDEQPEQVASLTLAIGVGIVAALKTIGVENASLKWPNDIVVLDGKLGGILTELQPRRSNHATVITGIGLNIDLPDGVEDEIESDWAKQPVDIRGVIDQLPAREAIAASVIDELHSVMRKFEVHGLGEFIEDWMAHDWLRDREVSVELPDRQISGVAAGIDADGALLIDTGDEKTRVVSGSIVMAGLPA
ncbi:MAG: biotin--[acetyl-CoA-carboxylase] ligase [Woeseiaceae bacterium]